jgi:2-polyprenyl-6-methoxyphenol hydroxylase-like FAD-dependent oxidoreductase
VVIGAGVGGLAAGAALQERGWDVSVLERSEALEAVGAGLALAPNALKALDVLGVGDQVRAQCALQGEAGIVRTDGRWISRTSAATAEARYGDPTVVLHRAALVDLLAGVLKSGTLQLGTQVSDVDAETGTVETWGRGRVFGVTILGDGRVYCYATAPAAPGGSAPDEKAELLRLFGTWHAPIPQLIAAADRVLRTDIRCLDRPLETFHRGRVALLGDAAHAMTPNLGQGGCQAIEDAVVLAAYADRPDGLARYSAERLPRTTAVAAASRRIGRLTRLSNPAAVFLRDTAMQLAGLGPNLVIKQIDPVLGWRPPAD